MITDYQIAKTDLFCLQQLRMLENRLDKMNLKMNEAKKIETTYLQILEHQKEVCSMPFCCRVSKNISAKLTEYRKKWKHS